MTLCDNCKAQLPQVKLATRVRKVNEALHSAGFIYWNTIGTAMEQVEKALEANGFALPENHNSYDGHALLPVGDKKYLSINLYRMESGRYELVAYVS